MSPQASSGLIVKNNHTLLPLEIIQHILLYIPRRQSSQPTFWACACVSRAWYQVAVRFLYERPYIGGSNFDSFVRTICPSINARVAPSPLATLVKKLDMSALVHHSNKSLTARILGRVKANLEEFAAPQSSFAINSLAALSKCTCLRVLDLSWVSASIAQSLLFQTLGPLVNLEVLYYPRNAGGAWNNERTKTCTWPPKLRELHLSGGIDDYFVENHLASVPISLEHIEITNCPHVSTFSLYRTLGALGSQISHLTIRHPMNNLQVGSLDYICTICPELFEFKVSADYISEDMLDSIPYGHSLCSMELDCSPTAGEDVGISPQKICEAVEQGRLPDLRRVSVSERLAWNATEALRQSTRKLEQLLEEREDEDPLGIEPDVTLIPRFSS
ncbi:hypothetical protein F5884DRAFT_743521 [Xylogone sp. PMI_703]|nr:hypothetical protein F5884DRAFT_743521 [Xylogone sp. PMI_703]